MPRDMTQSPVPVRRFEMGASGQGHDDFLKKHGYIATSCGGLAYSMRLKRIGARGRPKNIRKKKLMELLDSLRMAEGLEPIVKRD